MEGEAQVMRCLRVCALWGRENCSEFLQAGEDLLSAAPRGPSNQHILSVESMPSISCSKALSSI